MNNKKNKKILKFDISSENIKIQNLLTQQFLAVEINCISDAFPNRNNSYFTPEAMVDAIPSFKNKPILCHYMSNEDDYGAHDTTFGPQIDMETGIWYEDYSKDAEVPIGVIPESSTVNFYKNEEDGLNWLSCSAVLWVAYNYKAIKKLIKSKSTWVSVEVEVLESDTDENDIEHIKKFELLGITMLNTTAKYPPAISNAQLRIVTDYDYINSSEKFTAQFNKIKFAYDNLKDMNPNFKDPVENETPIDEITFDKDINKSQSKDDIDGNTENNIIKMQEKNKEGEVMPMTYQAKIDIVRIALKEILKWAWFYITDIDDEFVYYTTEENEITFKVPYEIHEGGAFVDMDKIEKVVRSWQAYSEDMDKNKKDFDILVPGDVEANAKAHIVHDDEKAGIDIKMSENKEECATEDECKMSTEDKEECAKEECAKEECGMPDNKGGDSSGDGKKEVNDCDGHKEVDSKEECAKEECTVEDECKMSTENKEVEQSTVQQPPIISQDTYSKKDYDELMCKFTALEKEHNILMTEYKNKIQKEQLNFAQNLINSEKDLDTESAKNIFSLVETDIKAEKFNDCDAVEKFTTQQIATTLYLNRKNNSGSQKNEFSYNIQKGATVSSSINGSSDDVEVLKQVNEKLKYL